MEYFIRFCREQWEFGRKGEKVISVRFRRPPSRAVQKCQNKVFNGEPLKLFIKGGFNVQVGFYG